MRRFLTVLGLLATLTLLVAACGGDEALSDREYFAALGDSSADAEARDNALDEAFPFDEPPDAETVAAFLDAFQAIFIDARADIAALAPPPDLAAAHDAMVAAQDAVITVFDEARADAETFSDVFDEARGVFDEFERSCTTLAQLAADRGIAVELFCGDE